MKYFENNFPDYDFDQNDSVIGDIDVPNQREIVQNIIENNGPSSKNCEGGLYCGNLGVAYLLYQLSKKQNIDEYTRKEYNQDARRYIITNLAYFEQSHPNTERTSFLLGETGVLVIGAIFHNSMNEKNQSQHLISRFIAIASSIVSINFRNKNGSDEIFNGRSGYLLGALIINRELKYKAIDDEVITKVYKSLVDSGRQFSHVSKSKCPLMYQYYGTRYAGAGHGLASIVLILMCFPQILKNDKNLEKEIHECVDYLLSLQFSNGNFPTNFDSPTENITDELVQWCHGGPGVIYTMARAYLRWKDQKYLDSCLLIGELTWNKGLLRKGSGICHGIAGSAYVFLLLYRLTNNQKHLYRAEKFAEFIQSKQFKLKSRTPDSPYSLFEGLAGTTLFHSDLKNPKSASFPLFDIFTL